MKRCVSPREAAGAHLHLHHLAPPPRVGWYIPDQFAVEEPPNITLELWNSQGRAAPGQALT